MIKLIDLTKTYKGLTAVDHINLKISSGAVFGFLGPNGAGKTTTIKMMAGILKPTKGRIIIDQKDLVQNPVAVKRCVGFIPDRPFLYEKLSGLEFLKFTAGLYGLDQSHSTDRRISGLLDLFEIAHWQNELIESYSHGMKQRLVMCAAFLHEPKVVIVDEPMVGLDPRAARLVKNIFRDEARKGKTIFMSTHSLEVAEEVCEDIAIIQAGSIIARGSGEELKQQVGLDADLEGIFLKLTEGKAIAHEEPLSAH